MKREQMIEFINKFNVATFAELRTWDDKRLGEAVAFIKLQLDKNNHAH